MKRLFFIIVSCFAFLEAFENVESQNIKSILSQWSSAMNSHNAKILWSIYGNKFRYYGKIVSKNRAIKDKKRFFKKYPNFKQYIQNDNINKIDDNTFRVEFDKYVKIKLNSSIKNYPSYLTIKKIGNAWKIVEEGDKVTDKNLQSKTNKTDFILKNHLMLESYKSSLYNKSLAKLYIKRANKEDGLGFKSYYLYIKSPHNSWWWKSPQDYSTFRYEFIDENRLLVVGSNDLYETTFLININPKKVTILGYGDGRYISYGKFKGMFKISGEKRYFFNKTKAQNGAYWIDYICDSRGNIIKYLNKADCKRKNIGDVENIFYIREIIENSKKDKHRYLRQPLNECIEVER